MCSFGETGYCTDDSGNVNTDGSGQPISYDSPSTFSWYAVFILFYPSVDKNRRETDLQFQNSFFTFRSPPNSDTSSPFRNAICQTTSATPATSFAANDGDQLLSLRCDGYAYGACCDDSTCSVFSSTISFSWYVIFSWISSLLPFQIYNTL